MKRKEGPIKLTPQQSNPYTAQPTDFDIVRDDDEIFHGQASDALIKQSKNCRGKSAFVGKQPRPVDASDAGPSGGGRP
jgi:hypothetical protein